MKNTKSVVRFSLATMGFVLLLSFCLKAEVMLPKGGKLLASAAELKRGSLQEVVLDGAIGPAHVDFYERALLDFNKAQYVGQLLVVNTPGGSLASTRLIVEKILAAEHPVVCLIAPAGAHAASAGAIILQACHFIAALPATHLGAATPITMGGGGEINEDLRKKMIQDTKSWLEAIIKERGRKEDFAHKVVENAESFTAEKALAAGYIDLVVGSDEELIQGLRTSPLRLDVQGIVSYAQDLRFLLLRFFSDPEIAYLIFMASLALLYFEVTHPGFGAPGILGSFGLILSLIAFHKLSLWWGGVGFILLGVGLLIAEIFITSFGLLGISGLVALFFGSVFLFDSHQTGYPVPWGAIIGMCLGVGAIFVFLSRIIYKSIRLESNPDPLIGEEAEVVFLSPDPEGSFWVGQVMCRGEIWQFKWASENGQAELKLNERVKIKAREGLQLEVVKQREKNK